MHVHSRIVYKKMAVITVLIPVIKDVHVNVVQLNVFTGLIFFKYFFSSIENHNEFSISFNKERKLA